MIIHFSHLPSSKAPYLQTCIHAEHPSHRASSIVIFPLILEIAGHANSDTHLSQLLQLLSTNLTGGFLVKPLIKVHGAFDIITAASFLSNASL